MDKEREKTTLRILIVADTWFAADSFYERFFKENKNIVMIPGKNRLILNDGTIIERLGLRNDSARYLIGQNYDQIILCCHKIYDDEYAELIKSLMHSQVPQTYWFLSFDNE